MILQPEEYLPTLKRYPATLFLHFLKEKSLMPPISIVDIGPFSPRTGGEYPNPKAAYWIPEATIQSFEGHPENFRKLQTSLAKYPAKVVHHPVALAESRGTAPFYETIHPAFSSLLLPNPESAKQFHGLAGLKLHRTLEVETQALDELESISCHGLYIDTNGSEARILRGAQKSVKEALFICIRVLHLPLFEEQADLGETQFLLSSGGLQFHSWRAPFHSKLQGCELNPHPHEISAEAIFFPSLSRMDHLDPAQLLRLAVFTSLYEAFDLTEKALLGYDSLQKTNLLGEYRSAFLNRFNPPSLAALKRNNESPVSSASTLLLTVPGEVHIAVPNTVHLLTPYVLREQGDWFETELPWLRRLVTPGWKILDIGSSYGLYSLSLSLIVGSSGKVWAVEPTPEIVSFLRQSRDRNKFDQLEIFETALSIANGEAAFYLSNHSEYNSLTPRGENETCVRVSTETLDHFSSRLGITELDLLKIDAEGEEINILDGAKRFLSDNNPLIMAEWRHEKRLNLELIDRLSALGYHSYRLIPGLGILTPVSVHEEADRQTVNIFACREDKATSLHQSGLLTLAPEIYHDVKFPEAAYELYLNCLPYGKIFSKRIPESWMERFEGGETYRDCLNAYCVSLLPSLSPDKRVGLLRFAFENLSKLIEKEATLPRLLTLSRISAAWGKWSVARNILGQLSNELMAGQDFRILEPFICAAPDFDLVEPGANPSLWCVATILHEKICQSALSTFYLAHPPVSELEKLNELGFLLPGMKRRLEVIRLRRDQEL